MQTLTMKFGGTSVGSPEAIASVAGIVGDEVARGSRVIVVVSAMSGVTDALLTSMHEAAAGNKWGYLSCAQKLRDRHEEAVNLLTSPGKDRDTVRSEEHTSELQSREKLVCRLLLEKKKKSNKQSRSQ